MMSGARKLTVFLGNRPFLLNFQKEIRQSKKDSADVGLLSVEDKIHRP